MRKGARASAKLFATTPDRIISDRLTTPLMPPLSHSFGDDIKLGVRDKWFALVFTMLKTKRFHLCQPERLKEKTARRELRNWSRRLRIK